MDKNKIENSLIPSGNRSLNKISNSLIITNKLLFGDIEKLFNEAFFLINSKDLSVIEENYCMWFELDEKYNRRNDFKYKAKEKNDYVKAIELFSSVLEMSQRHYFSHFFRGIAYYRLRKYQYAISDFSKSIELKNNIYEFYEYRGICYDKIKRFKNAIDDFQTCIALIGEVPDNFQILSELYHHLANSRYRINEKKSLIDYNKALQLDPKNIRCYNNRGRTLSSLGKEDKAKRDFINAIDLSTKELETTKDDDKLWYYRGIG